MGGGEQKAELLAQIDDARHHLSQYPAHRFHRTHRLLVAVAVHQQALPGRALQRKHQALGHQLSREKLL